MYSLPLLPRREVYRHGVELFQDFVAYVDFRRVCERGVCGDDERHSFFVYFEPVFRAFAQRVHDERRHARVLASVLRVELRLFCAASCAAFFAFAFFCLKRSNSALRLARRLSTYFCPALPGALASITCATSITATSARAGRGGEKSAYHQQQCRYRFYKTHCLYSFLSVYGSEEI